jgi:predicted amino acid-binding ACT domain protein
VDTLHTLNENIVNLGDTLMRDGLSGNMVKMTSLDIGQEEVALKATRDQVDQADQEDAQNKNQEEADSQKDNKVAETLQDLDKENH